MMTNQISMRWMLGASQFCDDQKDWRIFMIALGRISEVTQGTSGIGNSEDPMGCVPGFDYLVLCQL
jgi:hypothetical protein